MKVFSASVTSGWWPGGVGAVALERGWDTAEAVAFPAWKLCCYSWVVFCRWPQGTFVLLFQLLADPPGFHQRNGSYQTQEFATEIIKHGDHLQVMFCLVLL